MEFRGIIRVTFLQLIPWFPRWFPRCSRGVPPFRLAPVRGVSLWSLWAIMIILCIMVLLCPCMLASMYVCICTIERDDARLSHAFNLLRRCFAVF